MKQVEAWRKEKDKQLSMLYEINDHGKAFLSPRIRGKIMSVFTGDSDLALIDRGRDAPKSIGFKPAGMEYVIPLAKEVT